MSNLIQESEVKKLGNQRDSVSEYLGDKKELLIGVRKILQVLEDEGISIEKDDLGFIRFHKTTKSGRVVDVRYLDAIKAYAI
jgi:hypothetical protein